MQCSNLGAALSVAVSLPNSGLMRFIFWCNIHGEYCTINPYIKGKDEGIH